MKLNNLFVKINHALEENFKPGKIPVRYIKRFLPNNPIIIEAGAHNGSDTVKMAKVWPKGTIHAFEPIPQLFERLTQNTEKFNNIKCYPLALSNQIGTAEIFVSSGTSNGSSSLLKPYEHLERHPDVIFSQKLPVEMTTLDSWAKKNDVKQADFLWLDMQGYEPLVLQSSPIILKTVKLIYTEVNIKELYQGSMLYPEFRQWLEKEGFKVQREELAWEEGGNVLFLRK